MKTLHRPILLTLLGLLSVSVGAEGQEALRPLEHEDYDRWNRIQNQGLSPDGDWLRYRLVPGDGEATLMISTVSGGEAHEIARGTDAHFTPDSRFAVFSIEPMEEEDGADAQDPSAVGDSLGILDLASGSLTTRERVRSFQIPEESSQWLAYSLKEESEAEEDDPEPTEAEDETPVESRREAKETGTTLVLLNLISGAESQFSNVTEYRFTRDGSVLLYVASDAAGEADGVYRVDSASGAVHALLTGEGVYRELTVDEEGRRAAFLTNRDEWTSEAKEIGETLYLADVGEDETDEAEVVVREGTAGLPAGWWVSPHGSLRFSDDGQRLFFGTAPRAEPEPEEVDELLEKVELDVWSWHDDLLQPHQLVDREDERRRTYEAVYFLDEGRTVQLEDETLLSVTVAGEGNAATALGQDDLPYRQTISWDTRFVDLYLVDVATGERELVAEKVRGSGSISPEGRFIYWWDGGDWDGTAPRGWMVWDVESGTAVNATQEIPYPIFNEIADRPAPPPPAGLAGWVEGDEHLVVYDAHDLWLVDPRGEAQPRNLTAGYGRDQDLRLRLVQLADEPSIDLDDEVLLSAFDLETKADGYYRALLQEPGLPERLVMEDASFGNLSQADSADVFLFTRSTFETFPDLWWSDSGFEGRERLTDANPHRAEYTWGTAELVSWTSADGEELQGILYKPDDFDPSEEWPMMVYFYERSSNGLHNFYVPSAGTSINRSFYVSRGYLLFVPDIPYKAGYPGESAMNAVVPGVLSIVDQGFVDRERIGVQGHSWGGYQISYMLTRTNLFAAAEAGAPVTNMTSAYGGIRWASGRVRQMQYETGQSRIGGTLWDAQHRYIENSPLFTAYRVETPLLILHNDEDGAVPWEEGIQFFVALRRLGKPVWLLNYNGEAHGLREDHNQRDFTIRMQQFFDHHLRGAPPPVWMVEGIPAVDKGRTLGLDLVEEAVTDDTQQELEDGGGR